MSLIDKFKEPFVTFSGIGIPLYALPLLIIAGIVLLWTLSPTVARSFAEVFFFLWPVWLPLALASATWQVWIRYRNAAWWSTQETALYEIRIPREIQKSPLAMETVLSGLHRKPGESNFYDKYVLGKFRPSWSLEIASFEGELHFYIWGRKSTRKAIENSFYGQFPEIQIVEVEDYALRMPINLNKFSVWGCQFALTKDDVYPIKTYVDYGLDRDPKEEYKIDPYANLLEFLGSIGKGEQLWVQVIIQVTPKKWRENGVKKIQEIRKEGAIPIEEGGKSMLGLTEDQRKAIESIERTTSKQGFDVGIRGIYIAEKDHFDPANIAGLVSMFRQFSTESLNGFKPSEGMTKYSDYPWEREKDKNETRKELLEAYKRRGYFRPPDYNEAFVLSTEELATIFRLPGSSIGVPTLPRIQSATAEAPSDLPV